MKIRTLLLSFLCFAVLPALFSQNYLRVTSPDGWWGAPLSTEPDWEAYLPHGIFEDISLVVSPQGIYTEIEVFATITHSPDGWSDTYEIIWQFDLPAKTIVHDSWLWVEEEIIRADMIDFWTALNTYEDIVDRNEDPSFFYILPDNRYEIRIFPLFAGDSRRIKLSFLVPAVWNQQEVTQDLLQNMFQATDFPVGNVSVAMPQNATWGTPRLQVGDETFLMDETVVGGTGDVLHYRAIDGYELVNADGIKMAWDAPFTSGNSTFVSTYTNGSEQFYQLAYLPDWDAAYEDPSPEKMLILVDYQANKTTTSLAQLSTLLQQQLAASLSSSDAINVGVVTTSGVSFLSEGSWRTMDEQVEEELEQLLASIDDSNLAQLLEAGLNWAQEQGDATQVHLLAANDDYTYPPVAEEVFTDLGNLIDPEVDFFLLDYQNENVSIIYYDDDVYYGNSHLYQLLADAFANTESVILRDQSEPIGVLLSSFFPTLLPPSGVVDYSVNLQNGVCYERFNLTGSQLNVNNNGVLLQTGKYLGDFPLEIEGYLVTDDNNFYTINSEVPATDMLAGDTLMQEMWYAQHLQSLFGQVASDADREHIIDLSISERILTPLTAFLALEPELGGEPCVGCLFNNGEIILINTEDFEFEASQLTVTPNPTVEQAQIRLDHPSNFQANDWQAVIYDAAGRAVTVLPAPQQQALTTTWTWTLEEDTQPGIYFCKIMSEYGSVTTRIVVVK